MKKLSFLVFLILITSLTSIRAAEKVTITLTCYPSLDQAFAKILPDFYQKHPNIEVNIISQSYGDHHNKLVTAITSGNELPDIAVIEIGYIPQFVASGGFDDLNQPPYQAGRYRRKMAKYKWAQATDDMGRLIAFPLDIAPGCAYWRRDLFAEAGLNIDDIKTMDDLFAAAGKLTRDTDGDGRIDQWFMNNALNIAYMILRSSPKKIFAYENYHQVWNLKRLKDAFIWAKKFHYVGYDANIEAWTQEWYGSFQNGTIAYEISGAWLSGQLQNWMAPNTSSQWGVAKWPALNSGDKPMAGGWGGSFLGIPQKAAHKKEAWEFIKFACLKTDNQIAIYKAADSFPAYILSWKDPIFYEKVDFLAGQQARRLWIAIAKDIPEVQTTQFTNVADAVVGAELQLVLFEGKDIDKALDDLKSSFCIKPKRG